MEIDDTHLCYQAARLAVGALDADEIKKIIEVLSENNFYLDEFLDLPNDFYPRMSDMLPVFLAVLNHYNIVVPSQELAALQIIKYHLQIIISKDVDVLRELEKLLYIIDARADLLNSTKKYLGDSYHIEKLIGIYWEADDLRDEHEYAMPNTKFDDEIWSELKQNIIIEARAWLNKHVSMKQGR